MQNHIDLLMLKSPVSADYLESLTIGTKKNTFVDGA